MMPCEPLIPKRETLFEQAGATLERLIREGRWKPGEMLPNEIELARMFGVSQGTMRRALKSLVQSGVLIRHQGRGTFVTDLRSHEDVVYRRYIRLMPDDPARDEASPEGSRLVLFETVPAPAEVARALLLEDGTPVLHARRIHIASSAPVTIDDLWANAEVFSRLTARNLEHHEERMLYAFYQSTCGVTITRSEERIKAVMLPEALRLETGIDHPVPVIEVRRTSFTFGDRPVEYRVQHSITERYHYSLAMQERTSPEG